MAIIAAAEAFVKEELAGNDGSHDWWHIHRVRQMALLLAQEEGLPASKLEVVELAALLHDVGDWKYSGSHTAQHASVQAFLESQQYPAEKAAEVLQTVAGVGFKEELGTAHTGSAISPVLAAVQDADRLDAIGAIGIARCFTFGGRFSRVLHDPAVPPADHVTRAVYTDAKRQQTTLNHFHEKLLHIKDMMKTQAGRQRAAQRHQFMQQFLNQFEREWPGES
eukprot:jgi/Astpho2/4611/fgenesh1_pm.00067_%23_39_t